MAVYCELCSTSFPTRAQFEQALLVYFDLESDMKAFLDSHPDIPRSATPCPQCDAEFFTSKGLKQHIGKVHDQGYKACNCPVCGRTYKNKYAVKAHVRQVHEKTTRVDCVLCGRSLYNKYQLKVHVRETHLGR